LLQEPDIKLINDDELNRTINQSDQILDKETMMTVHDMLKSSDFDTIELGLKMLTGFNINETPLTISTLLLLNQRWWMTNARTNVLVQNMIKQLDISSKRVSASFPYSISYLRPIASKASEYDKELTKSLIFDKIVQHINNSLSKDIEFFKLFNTDIKIEIK
jgi:histidyl-tRNA synthetase